MNKNKIDIRKIAKDNPLIKLKEYEKESKLLEQRKDNRRCEYNILPPFTTERRIRTSA